MFTGLKSKLAAETKKLQNAVSQVAGEGISGFSIGKNNHSSLNSGDDVTKPGANTNPGFKSDEIDTGMLVDVPLPSDHTPVHSSTPASGNFLSANSSLSSFMDSDFPPTLAEGEQTPTRQRRNSGDSVASVDSIFMPQNAFSNTSRLSVITSDMETDNESVAGSTFVTAASKEQISSVLNRLQGRAANYKDRYMQLAKMYNEVVRENDKVRTILTTTQDKALRRIQELREEKRLQQKAKRDLEENMQSKLVAKEKTIDSLRNQVHALKEGKPVEEMSVGESNSEKDLAVHKERVKKLEELLSRCKDSMKSYKERVDSLSTENDSLKQKLLSLEQEESNAAISDFVHDRVAAEYKSKMQEAEEEWKKRISETEERAAMAVAETKKEMHAELELKDQTIETLRERALQLETTGFKEREELQEKLQRAENAEKILEEEKHDLADQLSRAKQAAVQIVREEENVKREQMEEGWRAKMRDEQGKHAFQLQQLEEEWRTKLAEKAKEYSDKLREYEEQTQLAIEERELQKSAVATKYDERVDQLLAEVNQLKTEKLELESSSAQKVSDLMSQLSSHAELVENLKATHAREIERLNDQLTKTSTHLSNNANELVSIRENIEQLEQSLKAAEEEKTELVKNSAEKMANLERRAKEELEGKVEQLTEQYEQKMKVLQGRVEDSQKEIKMITAQYDETMQQLRNEHKQELAKREQEWRSQQTESADEKVREYLAIIDQLREDKALLERDSEGKINEMKATVSDQLDSLNQLNASHASEVEQLNDTVSQLSLDITAKDKQMASTLEQVETLKQQLDEREDERTRTIMDFERQIAALELRAEEELQADTTKLANEYEEKIKILETNVYEGHEQFIGMKNQYEEAMEKLRNEHEQMLSRKEVEWRIQQVESADEKAKEYLEIIDQLREDKLKLEASSERRIAELESQIASYTEALENLNAAHASEIEDMKATVAQLSSRISERNDQLSSAVNSEKRLEELLKETEEHKEQAVRIMEDKLVVLENRAKEESTIKDGQLEEYKEKLRSTEENIGEIQNKLKATFTEHNEMVQRLRTDHEEDLTRRAQEWQMQQNASDDEKVKEYVAIIDQLRQERSSLQREFADREAELKLTIASLSQTLEDHSNERDQKGTEIDDLRAANERKEEQMQSMVKEMEKQAGRHDQMMKLAQDEWNQKAKDYDDRIAVLGRNTREELEVQLKATIADHNEKVMQLGRDFQMEMSKKENEWQAELNNAYTKSEEDRVRAVREYQKEAKQLHQELQEKIKRFNELKGTYDKLQKEKAEQLEEQKEYFEAEIAKLEDQANQRLKQRLEDIELKHKQELDGLSTEWNEERRSVPAAVQTSWASSLFDSSVTDAPDTAVTDLQQEPVPSSQLEVQAQIVQGDVRQESPLYLKQRVRQLEAQIEAMKEKRRKELLVNDSMDADHCLSSISLDMGSGLFAEPTEAEYLKNILFRYMTERESLGKESVTLAKAIAAVLKFSNDQTHIVISKEESRSSSNW